MSLLEDVFLEDEAGEAQELERIIEGDEYDDGPRPSTPNSNENSEKEDEAEEDKRHVDPTSAKPKRIVKNPRVILNPARLTGPRGIQIIPDHFKDFKFKGKGHEKEDLDLVLKKLEHWAYRLYPKFEFKDCLKKIETLGNKRPVMVHLTKIRTDQFTSEDTVVQRDSSDDEAPRAPEPIEDEFDKLLQQQIELARATPGPGTDKKRFESPMVDNYAVPKATSSPSINDEQRERMLRNRQMAEERRLARLKLNNSQNNHENSSNNTESNTIQEDSTNTTLKEDLRDFNVSKDDRNDNTKENIAVNTVNTTVTRNTDGENIREVKSKSNVIDSSDSDDDGLVINESVAVDIHSRRNYDSDEDSDIVHQNEISEDVNSDMVNRNEDDDEIHSDVRHNKKKQNLDIDQQNKNIYSDCQNQNDKDENSDDVHQNDNERDSKTVHHKNTVEGFKDSDDVEMSDNDNIDKSENNKNKELADLNKDTNCDNNDTLNDDITKHKVYLETLEFSDNSTVSKQISENENLKNGDLSSESKEVGEVIKESAITDVEDVMDVDFSDDF